MLDYEACSQSFYYDESSYTCLRTKNPWVVGNGGIRRRAGEAVGSEHDSGYYFVKVGNTSYAVHRIVWALHHGNVDPEKDIDHINRDRSDNRISNLRLVDAVINARNHRKLDANKSGVTGVSRLVLGQYAYWRATWKDLSGKQQGKSFSIEKLGDDVAFEEACKLRSSAIELLNKQGAGYSTDHGM